MTQTSQSISQRKLVALQEALWHIRGVANALERAGEDRRLAEPLGSAIEAIRVKVASDD